jgi:hypothetical protein
LTNSAPRPVAPAAIAARGRADTQPPNGQGDKAKVIGMRSLIVRDGLGWYVMPLGIALTCLVLWKRVRVAGFGEAILIGVVWTVIAIICDYFFLVKLLNPPDGYYKLDVYLYYLLTLILPIAAAMLRRSRSS